MAPADILTLAAYLAGFEFGVGLIVWWWLDVDDGGRGGPGDESEPGPLPGPSGRELVGAGR